MNKKPIIKTVSPIIAVGIIVSIVAVSAGGNSAPYFKCDKKDVTSDTGFSAVTDSNTTLENENILLTVDCETGHFSVLDKQSQTFRRSIPDKSFDNAAKEDKLRAASELTLTYYTSDDKKMYYCSGSLSRSQKSVEVTENDDCIRVKYSFGDVENNYFTPSLFTQQEFEEKILSNFTKVFDKRRISSFYRLYDAGSDEDAYQKATAKNDGLNKKSLYILSTGLGDSRKKELSDYMWQAGYSQSDYNKFCEKEGISDSALGGGIAGFSVTVEYQLNNDGFTAKVLTDKIEQTDNSFQLTSIDFLEYFGSADEGSGYFVIPDGSGAIVPINAENSHTLKKPFYGADVSTLSSRTYQGNMQNLVLPVYGLSYQYGGYFAIVEGGAECATLNIKTMGSSNLQNNAFCSFSVYDAEIADNEDTKNLSVNCYAKHSIYESPAIRYIITDADCRDYSSMAAFYQKYLADNKLLTKSGKTNLSLYVDFLCYYEKPKNILGISCSEDIALSTLSDISTVADTLAAWNMEAGISFRLKNYGNGGIVNTANNKFDINGSVGTKSQLSSLNEKLASSGGNLYLDQNFMYVCKDTAFDSFKQNSSSAKRLDKAAVSFGEFDAVTQNYIAKQNTKYYISPTYIPMYTNMFLKSYNKNFGKDAPRLSFSSAGSTLYSDFNQKHEFDRTMSKAAILNALEQICACQRTTVTDGGNMFTYKYSSAVIGLAGDCSNYDIESASVPFVQMILHGYIDYTPIALNETGDLTVALLRCAETGSDIYIRWITKNDSLLLKSPYGSSISSLCYKNSIESFKKPLKSYANEFSKLKSQKIIQNITLAEGIKKTVFENGTTVIVNYTQKAYTYENTAVDAMSYKVFVR